MTQNKTDNETYDIFEDYKIFVGVQFIILSLIGISLYLITVVVLYTGRKRLNGSFYTIIWHVAYGDIGMLLVGLLVGVPCIITRSQFYGVPATEILANLDTIFFYGLTFLLLTMTINRLSAIYPTAKFGGDKLFSGKKIYIWVGACWLLGVGVLVLTNLCGCPKQFNHTYFFFGFFCGKTAWAQFGYLTTAVREFSWCLKVPSHDSLLKHFLLT